jgi:hypothetical protein
MAFETYVCLLML